MLQTAKDMMNTNVESVLEAKVQSALATDIVTMMAAVVSNTSAPDSAVRALDKGREDTLAPEQRAAAAALQAYGARSAAAVLTVSLDSEAEARAADVRKALETAADDDALRLLDSDPDAGKEFKSCMSLAIASKCAQLIAAEIERAKTGRVNILNEEDAKIFEARHEQHQKQRAEAAIGFLSQLPARFPTFGADLFITIRRDVTRQVGENHKRPDIHAAVSALFDDAVSAMPPAVREHIAQRMSGTNGDGGNSGTNDTSGKRTPSDVS